MKKSYKNIIVIIISSLIIMLPMFLNNYYKGHDSGFHISNIESIKEQLTNNLSIYILPNMVKTFGYGTELFYPILSHVTTAYISIISGFDVLISLKIFHLLTVLLSGIVMYFLSKKLSQDNKIALISSIIYMTLPYHISDIYIRDALAETLLFIFIPLILLGLTYLFEDKQKFYFLFTIGYIGGILSHFTMMIYFTLFIIPFFIMYRKQVFKKDIIITIILSGITILLVTSPFFVTMISHKLLGNYAVFLEGHMAGYIWWAARNPLDYINIFKHFNTNDIKYYFDIVTIILLFYTLKNYKKIDHTNYRFPLTFGFIAMVLSTLIFPWDIMPQFFRMIQFPWRLVLFVGIIGSLYAPLCLKLKGVKTYQYILIIIALLISGYLNTNFASKNIADLKTQDYREGMGWQKEYLPVNTLNNQDYLNNRNYDIIVTDGKASIILDQTPNLSFTLTKKAKVELPRLYYLGYSLKDSLGNIHDIKENEYGFISAELEPGTYYLTYPGTKIHQISLKVSLITILAFGLINLGGLLWKKSVL